MIVYYVLIAILLILSYKESCNYNDNASKCYLKVALAAIWVIMAFRGAEVGTDTLAYIYMYQEVVEPETYNSYFNIPVEYEPGFYLVQVILRSLGLDAQWMIYITSTFYCVSLYYFLCRYSRNRVFCLFLLTTLGLFQFALSGMRQTIAIGILLFSFNAVLQRCLWKFLFLIVVAMQFHKSSFLVFPIYFISQIEVNKKNFSLLVLGLFAIVVFADKFLIFTAEVMDYSKYTTIEKADSGLPFFLIMTAISYFGFRVRNNIASWDKTYLHMLNVNFITLSVWAARLVSRTAERVSYYFLPYTCVVLEKALFGNTTHSRVLYILFVVVLSIFFFIRRLANGGFDYNFMY